MALVPNLKVLLVTGVGLLIALERINLLGADARRYLNAVSEPKLLACYMHISLHSIQKPWGSI